MTILMSSLAKVMLTNLIKSIWDESFFYIFTVVEKVKTYTFSCKGTIAYEMMEIQDMKDLDAILVPISGGGMTAGIAIAAKGINPDIKGT